MQKWSETQKVQRKKPKKPSRETSLVEEAVRLWLRALPLRSFGGSFFSHGGCCVWVQPSRRRGEARHSQNRAGIELLSLAERTGRWLINDSSILSQAMLQSATWTGAECKFRQRFAISTCSLLALQIQSFPWWYLDSDSKCWLSPRDTPEITAAKGDTGAAMAQCWRRREDRIAQGKPSGVCGTTLCV